MALTLTKVTTPEDWATYHRIRREVLFEAPGRFDIYREDHPDETHPNNTPMLMKADGVGVATVRLDGLPSGDMVIRLVAVTTPMQGQGLGRVLLEHVVEVARRQNVYRLLVNAAPDAVGYYHKMGFAEEVWGAHELVGISAESVQMVLYKP